MNNILDMTVDEFAQYLSGLNDKVVNFKEYEAKPKDKRSQPRQTRTFMNKGRGNFFAKSQWLSLNPSMHSSRESIIRQTVSGLRELNNTVNTGDKKKNQMRIER